MKWYLAVLKKYAVFSGRARRKEYWMFVLFNLIFSSVAMILSVLFSLGVIGSGGGPSWIYIYLLYSLAVLIPSLAVIIRRLHDIGKSGWWIFIFLIPLAGEIWLIVLLATDSQPGENQYGTNPKENV